ncbi:Dihydrolipoyllysine-residue acetyltransferase component of acetoin cleaving system [Tepidimonas alkaliphilus]|uniref:Dihydrolipoyllysine-residue acetyltransferase component of acetoin cleaving system n=1 Tax=Tepidimonas alkaliphilus TaxID=2588942 RepID=A0A554W6Q1_9BURK|nr:alpha/beta hydrolase [Tepidimonas alkaliphilus]TSE19242.1 Dihydrolipoyllysine-residue acetyltransferase component of acetoin cleaving system [Tepidimonas alkaliphilus]
MRIDVHGAPLYAYTGGCPFDPARPTVVFIHGVLNDHSVWILQSRYLAHHGFNVLAIDLPGHGRSGGEPPACVADGACAVLGLLDALGVERAALAGHSFGSLIALQVAADAPQRVSHLALVGTACPMRVSPALLDASLNAPEKAIAMVNVFSHSTLAPPPSALGPGAWSYGALRALMRRVLASNPRVNVLHRGLMACDTYQDGEAAARRLACPVQFILGTRDPMTPPKAAQPLIDGARAAGVPVEVVRLPAGHALMTEAPDGVLDALRAFLGRMQALPA